MFGAAVGAPIPGFDGAVGIWPLGEYEIVKNNSKYFSKGDERFVPVNVNRNNFVETLKTKVVPSILAKAPKSVQEVEVMFDSAGGHGGKYGVDKAIKELNAWGCKQRLPVRFITQPTKSPDFNVLDLGAWNSLQSAVEEVKYNPDADSRYVC
jgi:hypothetical protein